MNSTGCGEVVVWFSGVLWRFVEICELVDKIDTGGFLFGCFVSTFIDVKQRMMAVKECLVCLTGERR